MSLRLPAAAAVAVALLAAAPAGAADARYVTRTMTEPAAAGLPVTGPLKAYRASSRGRVVVPVAWQNRSAPAGQLRLRAVQNGACSYDLSYRVTSVVAKSQDPTAYVTAKLPAEGPAYVLDGGRRGSSAFRVIRRRTTDGRVRLAALWAGVLTRRSDIAPSGSVVWTEISVSATSRAGSECHSGTYRQALGPAIGDSLAVARAALHFAKA